MKKKMNSTLARIGIVFLLIVFVSVTGCIKYLPIGTAGTNDTHAVSQDPATTNTASPSGNVPSVNSTAVPSFIATTPPDNLDVADVDPYPYITPDPYRLPYRDHGNWTTGEVNRVPKIPQFTKEIILRSNSTAFRVNVTKGPLVVNLTFSPQFIDPDHTSLDGTNSFVSSNAEVTVYDAITHITVGKEGYNGIYSSDADKKITIYRDGSFIITLTGNFIDVKLAISTGSVPEPAQIPVSEYNNQENGSFE